MRAAERPPFFMSPGLPLKTWIFILAGVNIEKGETEETLHPNLSASVHVVRYEVRERM
jgi:hypothetical protein